MENKIKILIAFVLGLIISGVSVYAVTQLRASEIIYNGGTVESALNYLYDLTGNSFNVVQPIYREVRTTSSTSNRQVTFENLNEGKYLIFSTISYSWTSNTSYNSNRDVTYVAACQTGECTVNSLDSKISDYSGTKKDGYYINHGHSATVFAVEVASDEADLSVNYSGNLDNSKYPLTVHVYAIQIS